MPWFLRTLRHSNWLSALTQPLVEDWNAFLVWKDEMIYEAYLSGQVISLEMLLNDKFNGGLNAWNWDTVNYIYTPNTPNAIYILDNPNRIADTWLWTTAEARPPLWLWTTAEGGTDVFTVGIYGTNSGDTWTAAYGSLALLGAPLTLSAGPPLAAATAIVAAINAYSSTSGCSAYLGTGGQFTVVLPSGLGLANGTLATITETGLISTTEAGLVNIEPMYLWTNAEIDAQPDFVIYVPTALANVSTNTLFVNQVKGWVNKYRQAGARFSLVNY